MNHPARSTVLIVDDIADNIAVLSAALRNDHRVLFAINGADALRIVKQETIDLILLDVMMPELDGYEVCRRLKADFATRDIPVIFVTALADATDEARGLEAGGNDYLRKPCNAEIVRLRVRMHLEQHNQSLALERRVLERTRELHDSRIEIARRLGRAAEYRDNETGMHVIRMSRVAHLLALAAGVGEAGADLLLNAAPLHDIGKIGIPDHILLKPGRLDAREMETMKTHARIGAEIIGDHDSDLLRMARSVALTHHEKWDGGGYPGGLAGERIPLEGRIVAIADVYDALTSERPYKRAWSVEAALAYMKEQAGISFDPRLLDLFLGMADAVERIRREHADTPSRQG